MRNRHRLLLLSLTVFFFQGARAQTFTEILGRPTDNSITISVLFSEVVVVYFEFGTTPNDYSQLTSVVTSVFGTPVVLDLQPLLPDTRYYYRTVYKTPSETVFHTGPERTFYTQRAPGQTFVFTVEADEHLYDKKGVQSLYRIALDNQARDSADFMLSLGDTFGDDHTPDLTTSEDMRLLHLDYRQFLGAVCHSMPFFFCLGNHEGESGYWLDQTPPENIAVYGTQWRKFYYPNPVPNEFYSGNTSVEPYGIGQPENYYAFTWGDALFVILDVYRDCDVEEKPKNWDWTIGKPQYDWLKNTLETSTATHKFVFAHHNRGQGRGGIEPARGCEWGGYGNNGNGDWEFDQMRPGWEMPIHQLMVANGVKVFFQGHDHLFAKEEMDGLVYQEVPMPSDSTYEIGVLANADAYTDITLDGSGHIRVTVAPSCVTVDYVAAYLPADTLGIHKNRELRYSYQLGDCAVSTMEGRGDTRSFFSVFPNPAKGELTVSNRNSVSFDRQVRLFNLQGRFVRSIVLEAGREEGKVDLSGLESGLCLVQMTGGKLSATAKVIVEK
jgi:hypothetical protein